MNRQREDLDAGNPAAEVAGLVERYAATRLAPSEDELRRMRVRVLDAFTAHQAGPRPSLWSRLPIPRWVAISGLVLALLGGTSLAAAESGPGQPFYHLRLAVERLTLPAAGDARVQALLTQLDARLGDVRSGADRGDIHSVSDAIDAYNGDLAELRASTPSGGTDPRVAVELARHVAVLQGLLSTAPSQAQTGLQRAIDQATRAQQGVTSEPSHPGVPSPGALRSHVASPSVRP